MFIKPRNTSEIWSVVKALLEGPYPTIARACNDQVLQPAFKHRIAQQGFR